MKSLFALSGRQAFALAFLFGILITLAGLGVRELESGDETRVAGISAEMYFEGDYLIPRLNGEPFLEYPPLYYWSAAASYACFGIDDRAAKLPSALAALGCGLIVYLFARRLRLPPWCALGCCVMLMTSAQFFGNSRKCMVDMLLAFCILLAVFAFYLWTEAGTIRRKVLFLLLFAAAAAGGVMTKGLIGLVLPVAVLGCWLVGRDCSARRFSFPSYAALGAGTLLALAAVSVWYWRLYAAGGADMLHTVLVVNNFGRFSGSQGDHSEPFYYYLIKMPSLFWPWLPLVPFAVWHAVKRVRRDGDAGMLLVLSFLFVPLLLLTAASGKRIVYLLPLYAPCALLCGALLTELPEKVRSFLTRYGGRPAVWRTAVVLLCITAAVFIAISEGWSFCYPLLAAAFLLAAWFSPRSVRRIWLTGAAWALFFVAIDTASAPFLNRENSLRPMFEVCRAMERSGRETVLLSAPERTRGAAYFYLRRNVREIRRDETPSADAVLITRSKSGRAEGKPFADHHWLIP